MSWLSGRWFAGDWFLEWWSGSPQNGVTFRATVIMTVAGTAALHKGVPAGPVEEIIEARVPILIVESENVMTPITVA